MVPFFAMYLWSYLQFIGHGRSRSDFVGTKHWLALLIFYGVSHVDASVDVLQLTVVVEALLSHESDSATTLYRRSSHAVSISTTRSDAGRVGSVGHGSGEVILEDRISATQVV